MVNVEKIVLNEPIYYTPKWSGITKISVVEIVNDNSVLVQVPPSKKGKKFNRFICYQSSSLRDTKKLDAQSGIGKSICRNERKRKASNFIAGCRISQDLRQSFLDGSKVNE